MRYKTLDSGSMEKYCPMMFSKVLCPVDFSEAGMAALNLIKNIDQPINVHLISVIGKGENAAEVEARMKDAQGKLDALKTDLLAKVKINVTSEVLSAEAGYKTYGTGGMASSKAVATPVIEGVEGLIIQKAEEIDASLIALSSAGKGMLDQATVGSVVFDVARRATRPVLVARSEMKA
jgi:nucleotide-binding universal stress UspA family protein